MLLHSRTKKSEKTVEFWIILWYNIICAENIARELFGKLGFNNVTPNNDYMEEPRKDTMGVICANKHIYIKEGSDVREYNLIAVGMNKSSYDDGELIPEKKVNFYGFHDLNWFFRIFITFRGEFRWNNFIGNFSYILGTSSKNQSFY